MDTPEGVVWLPLQEAALREGITAWGLRQRLQKPGFEGQMEKRPADPVKGLKAGWWVREDALRPAPVATDPQSWTETLSASTTAMSETIRRVVDENLRLRDQALARERQINDVLLQLIPGRSDNHHPT